MFAVPGWAVSASALVQEGPSGKEGAAGSVKDSKKRKRGTESNEHAAAVEKLFSAPTPETKTTSKDLDVEKKKEKKQDRKQPDTTQGKNHVGGDLKAIPVGPEHRRERKKQRKQLEREQNGQTSNNAPSQSAKPLATLPPVPPPASKLTPLQLKMRSKLTSARFRHLNETLYTTTSSSALDLFTNSPELFAEYHAGFSQQVKDSWPLNPVETYVKAIRTRGALSNPTQGVIPLPRRKTGSCTIADLGCGDAPLARGCQSVVRTLQLKFHNYDLHTPNNFVTKADISNLPLRDGEADIAVFCLSLMGTNWISFVEEAWRILRGDGKGEVWVAEVKSRFGRIIKGRVVDNSVGKRRKVPKKDNDEYDGPEQFVEDARMADQPDDETDISAFVKVFTRRGFQLREGSVNKNNKMFVSMIFTKSGIPTAGKHKDMKWTGKEYTKQEAPKPRFANAASKKDDEDITPEEEAKVLKPCVYKVR